VIASVIVIVNDLYGVGTNPGVGMIAKPLLG
jgi:hypothetical protein